MLDHVALNVSDYERSRAFYLQALEPLGIGIVMEFAEGKALGMGDGQKPYLWIHERGSPCTSTHVALAAPRCRDRRRVPRGRARRRGYHNGAPGMRPQYHPSYYGAFVLDPDGNNLEAVCHSAAVPDA